MKTFFLRGKRIRGKVGHHIAIKKMANSIDYTKIRVSFKFELYNDVNFEGFCEELNLDPKNENTMKVWKHIVDTYYDKNIKQAEVELDTDWEITPSEAFDQQLESIVEDACEETEVEMDDMKK